MKKIAKFFKENTVKIAVAALIILSLAFLILPDSSQKPGQTPSKSKAAKEYKDCFFISERVRDFLRDKGQYNAAKATSPAADISRTWGRVYRTTLEKRHGSAPSVRGRGKCYPNSASDAFDKWFEGTYKAKLWPRYVERFAKSSAKQ